MAVTPGCGGKRALIPPNQFLKPIDIASVAGADTGSLSKWRWTSAARPLAVFIAARAILLQRFTHSNNSSGAAYIEPGAGQAERIGY